ncbi:hypothetical protein [Cetobacterium sp.]|uniref:hypothetical protein n=1 Tax=Cetobacterium sp. TaxID=2071632 RepID=UPI003F3F820F
MEKIVKILNTNNYSINLRSDFKNKEKLNAYYPTFSNMRLLDKVLLSIENKTNGSIILSGAYGTGKSYFTALLTSILSSNLKLEDYRYLIDKSKNIYDIEESFRVYENKKYLTVFIDDSMDSFSEAVFSGVRRALKEENIDVHISSKIDIIEEKLVYWREKHKNIYKNFKNELEKNNFSEELKYKTKKVETIFSEVYSNVFGGEKFSYNGNVKNIKDLLQDVENGVKDNGYSGVIYIFDEFGRYLETNINNIDVKEIQDTAEYCNLQNNSNLLVITHKDIFQYTRKIKNTVEKDEWEKVSGRFLKEPLIFEKDSILKILKNIIQKNNYETFREDSIGLKTKEILLKSLVDDKDEKQLTKDYYPLDYITATALPDLSQKLAQNERTLFAFICSDEPKGLKSLIYNKKNPLDFITLDYLYDYFEREIKQLSVESNEYKTYIFSKEIISKIPKEKEFDKRVVKAIAMIYINNNFSEIKPDIETLRYIFNTESLDLNFLEKNKLIVFKKYQNFYKLLENTNLNIEKKIEEYCEKRIGRFDYIKRLEEELNKGTYYPLKYNDLNKLNRYFGQYYIDASDLGKLELLKENTKEDGRIVYLTNIESNPNYKEIAKSLKESNQYILIDGNSEKLEIYNELKELEGIALLKEELIISENETLKIELDIYKREIKETISKRIDSYFSKKIDLLNITNDFLSFKYPKYIGVNYELINKRMLSIPMKRARHEILNKLNKNIELTEEYFKDTKAESSVARVMLFNTGLYFKDEKNENYLKFSNFINEIKQELKNKNQSLRDMYLKYCSNCGDYGIREGIFTFLLGILYIENKDKIVFSFEEGNSEINFSLDILDSIEKNPEKYRMSYYSITKDEVDYTEALQNILKNHIKSSDNRIYNRVLDGVKNYLLNQPRYVGSMYLGKLKGLNKIYKNIFMISNAKEFILNELPKIYKTKKYEDVLSKLELEMITLEESKVQFLKELEELTVQILSKKKFDNFKSYINNLETKEENIEIENYLESLKNSSVEEILQSITKKIKGFSYQNWRGEQDLEEYKKLLDKELLKKEVKENIEGNSLKIKYQNREETISLEDLDVMEKMLSSKISAAIKNMGFSLTTEQKRKVVAKILIEIRE